MMDEKQFPQRKSPRLQGYDYSQSGAYFVTICTRERYLFFGDVVNGVMQFTSEGEIAHRHILAIPAYWDNVEVDFFVVMPNHIHMIILIYDVPTLDTQKRVPTDNKNRENVGTAFLPSGVKTNRNMGTASGSNIVTQITDTQKRIPTLGQIIGNYKSGVTREIRQSQGTNDRIWQSRYHDHIIRSEDTLNILRQYCLSNPAKWEIDEFHQETIF